MFVEINLCMEEYNCVNFISIIEFQMFWSHTDVHVACMYVQYTWPIPTYNLSSYFEEKKKMNCFMSRFNCFLLLIYIRISNFCIFWFMDYSLTQLTWIAGSCREQRWCCRGYRGFERFCALLPCDISWDISIQKLPFIV